MRAATPIGSSGLTRFEPDVTLTGWSVVWGGVNMANQCRSLAAIESAVTPIPTVLISQPVLRIENFLGSAHVDKLLGRAVELRDAYVPSTTTTGGKRVISDYRRSSVVYDLGDARAEFESMILACVPMLRQIFAVPEGDPSEVEIQLTISDDGDYFKVHTDTNTCPDSPEAGRLVTFVYYFSRDQAAFTGGDLILYDSPISAPSLVAPTRHVIPPTRNSVVFFRSTAWHEVTPVVNPSGQFCDGRFTVNGWLRWQHRSSLTGNEITSRSRESVQDNNGDSPTMQEAIGSTILDKLAYLCKLGS